MVSKSTRENTSDERQCVCINIDTVCNLIEDWVSSMRHANASPSYNAGTSRMRMRGLSKSTNRTSRLIYGFCKPCTVIGLSRGWSEAKRTKCEIIQERQIEFRRAYISDRLDLKISSAAIIISTRRREGTRDFPLTVSKLFPRSEISRRARSKPYLVTSPESKFQFRIDPASSVELEGSMKNGKLCRLLFYLDTANSCFLPFYPCSRNSKMLKKRSLKNCIQCLITRLCQLLVKGCRMDWGEQNGTGLFCSP